MNVIFLYGYLNIILTLWIENNTEVSEVYMKGYYLNYI